MLQNDDIQDIPINSLTMPKYGLSDYLLWYISVGKERNLF